MLIFQVEGHLFCGRLSLQKIKHTNITVLFYAAINEKERHCLM